MTSCVPNRWRLIPLYEGTGAEQMAIDSWLLDQHVRGLQLPSLRFYTWRLPTISLGYHQRQFPAHWHNLYYKGQKVELIRRPTGGRAVLHQGDLTYALVTPKLIGSRRDVYQQLCQFLIEGWRELGIELTFGAAKRDYIRNPNCFGTATAADLIMSGGYKLIGSAQVYRKECVLQHGSIRLQPDQALFELVFEEEVVPPHLKTGVLDQILDSLVRSASKTFNVEFERQILTAEEIKEATTNHLQVLDRWSS